MIIIFIFLSYFSQFPWVRHSGSVSEEAYSHGWEVGAGCRLGMSVPLSIDLSTGQRECPHVMVAAIPRVSDSREQAEAQGLYQLDSEGTRCDFCPILLVTQSGRTQRGLRREVNARSQGSLRATLEAGYHTTMCRACKHRAHERETLTWLN